MLEALWWGTAAGSTLIVGALIGCFVRLPRRLTAAVMAAGAGVLFAAVAYDLVGEAATSGTLVHTAIGMASGSLAFFVGDVLVSRAGGGSRKRSNPFGGTASRAAAAGASGAVLAFGAFLDGVPESAAIGVTLLHGGTPSVAFVVAVALSNLPEGLSSSVAMRRHGHGVGYVLTVWAAIVVSSGVAAALGYAALGGTSVGTQAFMLSFAAGAVLTMVASTMLPEAAEDGGPVIGLVATAGFLASVLLDRL
ncbi:MAG: ZIP family metal transporter [Micromonosporaceae bacterium]